jgi:hypothetical protein
MRKLVKILAGFMALYAMICAVLFTAMSQSPDAFARTMKHVPWAAFIVIYVVKLPRSRLPARNNFRVARDPGATRERP